MRKEIKSDGNSHKLRLNAEDMRIYELRTGDIVDIELVRIKRGKNVNKKRRKRSAI